MTRRQRQEWFTVEQVVLAGSAWSTADQGGGQVCTFEGRTARKGVERVAEGVDCGSVGNPRYLGPFPL